MPKHTIISYAFVQNVSMNDVRQLTDSMRSHSPSAMNLKLVLNVVAVVVFASAAAAGGVGGNDIVVVVVVAAAALSIPHVKCFYTHQHGIVQRA